MTTAATPLRILLVNWQDPENPQAGGAEIHLFEIFSRLVKRGHTVELLCGGWKDAAPRATIDGIDVHRFGTRQTFAIHARRAWQTHFASRAFDVLVEDINKIPLSTPRWGANRVMALVPHLFGDTAFQELSIPLASAVWLMERPLPFVYRGVPFEAISDSTADDLALRGVPRANVEVIYPGIDSVAYTPAPGTRAPQPVFSYLGRLKRYKGVDIVIRAFAEAGLPNARLQIAGAGDYQPELQRLAASLDLGSRVEFLGRVDEPGKLALLRRSWALMFASPKEGWGITNLEAAACATPVIASNSPGIRESVRDGETGFLVAHGDVRAMAARMRELASDPPRVEAIGRRARSFAETFTWERAADMTEDHLRRILSTPRR